MSDAPVNEQLPAETRGVELGYLPQQPRIVPNPVAAALGFSTVGMSYLIGGLAFYLYISPLDTQRLIMANLGFRIVARFSLTIGVAVVIRAQHRSRERIRWRERMVVLPLVMSVELLLVVLGLQTYRLEMMRAGPVGASWTLPTMLSVRALSEGCAGVGAIYWGAYLRRLGMAIDAKAMAVCALIVGVMEGVLHGASAAMNGIYIFEFWLPVGVTDALHHLSIALSYGRVVIAVLGIVLMAWCAFAVVRFGHSERAAMG